MVKIMSVTVTVSFISTFSSKGIEPHKRSIMRKEKEI